MSRPAHTKSNLIYIWYWGGRIHEHADTCVDTRVVSHKTLPNTCQWNVTCTWNIKYHTWNITYHTIHAMNGVEVFTRWIVSRTECATCTPSRCRKQGKNNSGMSYYDVFAEKMCVNAQSSVCVCVCVWMCVCVCLPVCLCVSVMWRWFIMTWQREWRECLVGRRKGKSRWQRRWQSTHQNRVQKEKPSWCEWYACTHIMCVCYVYIYMYICLLCMYTWTCIWMWVCARLDSTWLSKSCHPLIHALLSLMCGCDVDVC